MKPADDAHNRGRLDQQARQWHAAALTELSPATLARLRAARHAAQTGTDRAGSLHGQGRWLAATAFTALLAVAIGVRVLPWDDRPAPAVAPAAPAIAAGDTGSNEFSTASALDEDPDLYLWLASADAPPLAME